MIVENEFLMIITAMLVIISSGIIINLTKNKQNKVVWQEVTKTLLYFKIAIPVALLSGILIYRTGVASYAQSNYLVLLGITLVLVGLYFRWEAIRKLSGMFTVKISIVENHELMSSGVFKYVRHPSYLGMVFYFSGLGFLMHNYLCFLVLVGLPLSAILIRIFHEEKALGTHFKEAYAEYQKRSWKLIPYLY